MFLLCFLRFVYPMLPVSWIVYFWFKSVFSNYYLYTIGLVLKVAPCNGLGYCFMQYMLYDSNISNRNEVTDNSNRPAFKVTVSMILSDVLNRIFSFKLEYFGENVFASNSCLGYSNSSQSRWLRFCMMNCARMYSVWKNNRKIFILFI